MKLYRVLDGDSQAVYAGEIDGVFRRIDGDVFGAYRVTDTRVQVRKLLPPVAPPNIFAIGRNYRAHAEETGTVILTGTPEGVGAARHPPVFLREGDTITCAVEGIGELTNPVIAAAAD